MERRQLRVTGIVFAIVIGACGSDGGSGGVGSVAGTVVNVVGESLTGVRVRVGEAFTLTDTSGNFALSNVPIRDGAAVVSFELDSYGGSVRRVPMRPGEVVQTRAVLKAANVHADRLDPVSGFTVADGNGLRLVVPPGSLVDEGGVPVDELVETRIVTGDPTDRLEAAIMPGDYQSDDAGGTPLDSVAFLDIQVRTMTGHDVKQADAAKPLVVELPIPFALQGGYSVGDAIPWWSFNEDEGFWRQEGLATVFDDGGTLMTRAEVTHLSWWNVDNPIDTHGCICLDVVDGAGDPIAGVQVLARGVTYQGRSSPVTTDENGRACVTVKNSVSSPEQVNLFVLLGSSRPPEPAAQNDGFEIPYDNPVDTPDVEASCLRDRGCPESCDILPTRVVLDRSGLLRGTVRLRSGALAVEHLVSTNHGSSTKTDTAGVYRLTVFRDVDFTVSAMGHESEGLRVTSEAPELVHDIVLANQPPQLLQLSMNGVPQVFICPPWEIGSRPCDWTSGYVADETGPVEFEASAFDLDGDPVTFSWSAHCIPNPGPGSGRTTIACSPETSTTTTCDPPTPEDWKTSICIYTVGLDDGYVKEPVNWDLYLRLLQPPP